MNWNCELTVDGWSIVWSKPCGIPAGGSVAFYAGLDPGDLDLQFTSTDASGSYEITLPGSDTSTANASGRMDILVDDVLYETGQTLPLVPGMSLRAITRLRALYDDHKRIAKLMDGFECSVYRRRADGTICPDCVDPITGAIMRNGCTTCDGSGRTVGWLGPYTTYVMWVGQRSFQPADTGAGALHMAASEVVRLGAFPRPLPDDVLLVPGGRVYVVGAPQKTVAGISGIPAVIECPIKVPDPGSPEASVPVDWI